MQKVIIFKNEFGGVSVCHPSGELPIEQVQIDHTPTGSVIVNYDSLPWNHNIFFDAWELEDKRVNINLSKAKNISHNIRRAARTEELKPFDDIIMKQIPGNDAAAAETARASIREKYSIMQVAIDSATTVDEIKSALPSTYIT